jgi:hypothetical protein
MPSWAGLSPTIGRRGGPQHQWRLVLQQSPQAARGETAMIGLILRLLVVGVLWYLAECYISLPAPMRILLRVVCLIAVVLYVLQWFNLSAGPVRVR